VSRIARRHDLNSNMVFRWRREYRSGDLTSRLGACAAAEKDFVPVGVVDSQGALLMLPAPDNASADADAAAKSNSSKNRPGGGVIEIVLPNGLLVRVGAHVEDQALRRVVSAMKEIP
jgi:transposase